LLIGVVAAAVGGALALALTPVVAGLVSGAGFAPVGLRDVAPAWPILIAIGSGLAVVVIGSLPAARSAARIPAIQALRDAAVPALRMTAGRWALAAVLLVGIGLEVPLVLTAPVGVASAYLVLVILTVVPLLVTLSPLLFACSLAALATVTPRSGLMKILIESARTAMTRTAAMTTPVLVSLALGAGLLSTTATTTATLGGDASADLAAIATVIGVTLAYSGLSIVVTSAIGTAARRDEFSALRRTGLSRRGGLALVVLDVALVLMLSALLAALAVAAVCALALAQLSSQAPPMLAIPAAPIGLLLAGCAVLLTGPALIAAVPALRGR
jgi:putative ABC transport system permease protein